MWGLRGPLCALYGLVVLYLEGKITKQLHICGPRAESIYFRNIRSSFSNVAPIMCATLLPHTPPSNNFIWRQYASELLGMAGAVCHKRETQQYVFPGDTKGSVQLRIREPWVTYDP